MYTTIQLPCVFHSGAVLQRDCPVAVWGWAPPARRVRVTMAGAAANGWVSEQGDFRVVLPPLPAGGPHVLRVELPDETDSEAIEQADILLGEVWLGSGQSNMQWTLEECGELGAQAAAGATDPLLRMFTVKRRAELAPQRDAEGTWKQATAETAHGFSAVGYYFARRLRAELGVPVGIIVSAWGGTPIEAWLSRRAQVVSPLLRAKLREYEDLAYADERWQATETGDAVVLRADPGICESASSWAHGDDPDADGPLMELPSAWQRFGHDYSGIFWFRKRVTIPAAWVGQELLLELGAIDKQDITYVNGLEVGRTGKGFENHHWNQPRAYRVPAAFTTGRELLVAVRVYSFIYDGGLIGPKRFMRLSCPQVGPETVSLAGNWHYRIEENFGRITIGGKPGHLAQNSPGILYDNMIAPLVPFTLRGVLWYQGESNVSQAIDYPSFLRAMIKDWRYAWELGDLPFLVVQLPGFGVPGAYVGESNWALMRKGQLDLLREVPRLGIAVTIDCGDAEDIHPVNKEPVGNRLAQWALAETYGTAALRGGPLARGAQHDEHGRVWVDFDDVGSGLSTTDGSPVAGVFLIDSSGVEFAASVEIVAARICAHAHGCPRPVTIAYAYADFPLKANLANREGFPASPFHIPL